MNMKITISNYYTGEPIYSHERKGNTLQKTIDCAIEDGVSLDCAEIHGTVTIKGQKIKTAVIVDAQLEDCELTMCDIDHSSMTDSLLIKNWVDECKLSNCRTTQNKYVNRCLLTDCEEIKL